MQRRLGARPARYTRTVTGQDLGERVSVRHIVDDHERGPLPTDVVGRLVGFDDAVMVIIDRHRQLHVVAHDSVVAAKAVPPHPKLPPEPPVPTRQEPFERDAARLLVLDDAGRVLLLAHHPDSSHVVWTGPGGGTRPGESLADTARREAHEELGTDIIPGPVVLTRTATFPFRGVWIRQHETWFLAANSTVTTDDAPLHDAGVSVARWWRLPELKSTDAAIEPPELVDLVDTIWRTGTPGTPWVLPDR